MDKIEKGSLSFIILVCVSFALFIAYFIITPVTTQTAATEPKIDHTEVLETYTYTITKINPSGYYGTSTKDDTGIYFVNENVPKGTTIKQGDIVKVTFPLNNYEEITHIEKVKSNIITQQFTITSYNTSTGQYEAVNDTKGTDKDKLFFTNSDIKNNVNLTVNDKIVAYYNELTGEDQFINVETIKNN